MSTLSLRQLTISSAFLRTSTIVVLGQGLTALIGVAALRIYTELAPQEVFGTASLVLGALALGLQVFIQPITATQIRYHSEAKRNHSEAKRNDRGEAFTTEVIRWALAAAAVLATVAVVGLVIWGGASRAPVGPLMVVAVVGWIVFSTLNDVFMSRLHAEQRMTTFTVFRVAKAILFVLGVSLALFLADRTESFIWGQVVGIAVVLAGLVLFAPWPVLRPLRLALKRPIKPRSTPSGFSEKLQTYGLPFAPMALLAWLANLADRYVLAALIGVGAAGRYQASFAIASAGFMLTNGAMGDIFRPKLFDAEDAGDAPLAQRVFLAWLITYMLIGLCGLAAIAFLGHWIVAFVLAEPYRPGAVELMVWISFGYVICGLTTAFENRILSLGFSGRILQPLAVGATSNIILSYLFISWHGIVGAAQASCLSFALQFFLTAAILRRTLAQQGG